MKALLVYPQYPDTFWSFRHALKFIGKKAAFPPLGLLTVAAMLPAEWELQAGRHERAPLCATRTWPGPTTCCISAMTVQRESARRGRSRRCRAAASAG